MADNPFAFPQPIATLDGGLYMACEKHQDFGGMLLRDWFAGQALAGNCGFTVTDDSISADQLVAEAYAIADAMMAHRSK